MTKRLLTVLLLAAGCVSPKEEGAGVRPYTLDTCVVMDSKLGSMGDPIVRVYDGQEVKFCCEPCVEEFESDPGFYLGQLEK